MLNRWSLILFVGVQLLLNAGAEAQIVYHEDFDIDSTSNWTRAAVRVKQPA